MLKGTALRWMVISLLETGRHPMIVFMNVLVNKKSNAMLVFILFFTEENLVSFLCCCFAKVLSSHFTESTDVPSVPVHFACQFLKFPCGS